MFNLPTTIIALAMLRVIITRYWGTLRIQAKIGQNSIYEFQGEFINRSGIIDNDINVVLPASKVDIYARRKIRQTNELPIDGIKYMRSYNTPCIELSLHDFLEGRNNLLDQLITDLSLSLQDWENYVVDLLSMAVDTNISLDERKAAHKKINSLIKETKRHNNLPQLGSFWGNLFAGTWTESSVYLNTRDQLSKALFLTYQEEFLIPLVVQVYPNPIPQNKESNRPNCYDVGEIGVCCLYDEEIQEVLPGLNKTVKIYKDCLPDIDKADCLNRTKIYSKSRTDATLGKYDGAEFYAIDEAYDAGCENCKNPVSVVYCSDGVPFIYKNKKSFEIKNILESAFEPTDIKYFNEIKLAEREYNKRIDNRLCGYFQEELDEPQPPYISNDICIDDTISIVVNPPSTGCNLNNDDKLNYHFYIDGIEINPLSIAWNPGPNHSVTSTAIATFPNKYVGLDIAVTASKLNIDEVSGSIKSGPESKISNIIALLCEPSPSPSPSPSPVPGFPVSVVLDSFSGLAENCSNYDGTYVVEQPFINGDPSNYNTFVSPPNNYATGASVDVGYNPNFEDIYVCLNLTTPDGSFQLCQSYDIDWNTGNYALQNGFPTTPWCNGNISLIINN